jgi:hypothetical protein
VPIINCILADVNFEEGVVSCFSFATAVGIRVFPIDFPPIIYAHGFHFVKTMCLADLGGTLCVPTELVQDALKEGEISNVFKGLCAYSLKRLH